MEEYKKIKEFPNYEVSNLGNIKRIDNGKIRKKVYQKGYVLATFYSNKKFYRKSVHRLVCIAFIDNNENKPCVNHINGVKDDNRVENLEWCTYSENIKHAYDNDLRSNKVGQEKANSKLKLKQVIELLEYKRDLKDNEIMPITYFSKKFNVSISNINCILYKRTWKHVVV